MKSIELFTGFLLLTIFNFTFSLNSTLSARDYYQIKVYTVDNKTEESSVEKYLKEAYLPALHRAGIKTVGVFKPIESDKTAGTKIFVFIPLKKLDDIEKIEAKLKKDTQYKNQGADYINASWDKPPYQRIESILIRAFVEMPKFAIPKYSTPTSEQIYELRSYQGPTEKIFQKKLEMFNESGEVALFKKLEFNAVFYGEVISGSAMPNLMYMTTFKDMKSHDEHWDAFRNHPVWENLKNIEEYKHTVSHIDKWLLHPTEYSDI